MSKDSMHLQNEHTAEPSPLPESQRKSKSPNSRTKKSRLENSSEMPNPSPLGTGSTSLEGNLSESTKRTSLSVSESSAKPTQEEKKRRASLALRRLGVDPGEVAKCPAISPSLKKCRGGLKGLLNALRFNCDDPDIGKFLDAYDAANPSDIPHLSWEAICLAAQVNPKHFYGAAILAANTYCGNTSRMIAVTSHPAITKARVKYALMPSGEKDRNALDIMVGALPSAKGPTFIGKAVFGAGGGSQEDDDEEDKPSQVEAVGTFGPDDDIYEIFPPANEVQDKLISVRQRLTEGSK